MRINTKLKSSIRPLELTSLLESHRSLKVYSVLTSQERVGSCMTSYQHIKLFQTTAMESLNSNKNELYDDT